ncbi:MAG TPA: hypothetical protein VMZ53_11720 [Kofleriaceae bacterium]|nr:hypothetical protein [Kofleriaceae bacterium]
MQIRDLIPAPIVPLFDFVCWVGSVTLATAIFWMLFGTFVLGGCIDTPLPDVEPQARLLASWDPLSCGDPHRVVIELEDDAGAKLSSSVPCEIGEMHFDIWHWGIYRGRIYAWMLDAGSGAVIRSEKPVRLEIDAPIVQWLVETPR